MLRQVSTRETVVGTLLAQMLLLAIGVVTMARSIAGSERGRKVADRPAAAQRARMVTPRGGGGGGKRARAGDMEYISNLHTRVLIKLPAFFKQPQELYS